MKITRYCIIAVFVAITYGCAATHRANPVIDPTGVDMGKYQNDLAQCEQIARQVKQKAGSGAVGGALVGALMGSIVGDSRTATKSAGAGAVVGAAKGGAATRHEKDRVVKNCMRDRGYKVLN